ncbi:MAG: transporter substrate-binding domain-containing protein [Bdellovibrionota bacterium]
MKLDRQIKFLIVAFIINLFCFNSNALENNTLRVCTSGDFFPFETKTSDGKWVGLDIDMLQAFSKTIQANLKIVDMRWDGVIPALLSNKCDLVAGGLSVTKERKKIMLFSDTILKNGDAILANKVLLPVEESLQDMDKKNKSLAIRTGTVADIHFSSHPPKNLKLLKFDDNATLINALLLGKVNAIAQDRTLLVPVQKAHSETLRLFKNPVFETDVAVAARKQDANLIAKFNKFLKKWKKTDTYKDAMQKYF